jgi:Na+/H+ antiporter NhaD/arsenite permease-like protein
MKETKIVIAALNVDISLGNYFSKTITAISTMTVSNTPATGTVASFVIDLTNGGAFAVTWWAGMKWAAGTAPTLTASGRDVLGFFTHDGGTTWSGLVLAKDIK